MEKGFGNRSTSDVTVYLIPNPPFVESGDSGRKRKRNAESSEGFLDTLNVHSERLCHCSKYFQILLDKRWSKSDRRSPTEFSLEVHTDLKYYVDCFSRMYTPNFTGIPSVDHALELLKVASQIEYEELMDACMGYLSVVPWLDVEETKIRKFPFSTYVSSGGLSELKERLRLHGTNDESYRRLYDVGLDYLRSSLETAVNDAAYAEEDESSCTVFASAFYDIVQSGSCYNLARDAYALLTRRAQAALLKTVEDSDSLESNLKIIRWLFGMLLHAKGAKELVKHMVHDKVFRNCLWEKYRCEWPAKWPAKWMTTLLFIFKEVLAGRLLLTPSERVSLFTDWEFLIFEPIYEDNDSADAMLSTVTSFIMTLPHEHQTTKLKKWLLDQKEIHEPFVQWSAVEVAQLLWIKDLQRSLAALDSARACDRRQEPEDKVESSSKGD